MGQQQLLLLVLSIVIVTIAVYIGIDLFSKSSEKSHLDSLVGYSISVASDAIQWREKRSPFLGGGGSYQALGTGTAALEDFLIATNRPPGQLAVESSDNNTLVLVGISTSYPELGIRVRVETFDIVSTITYRNNEICSSSSMASELNCP